MALYHNAAYTLSDVAIPDASLPSSGLTEADADLIVALSAAYSANVGASSLAVVPTGLAAAATLTLAGGLPAGARVSWDFGEGRVENAALTANYTYTKAGVYQVRATVTRPGVPFTGGTAGRESLSYYTQVKAG